MTRHHAPLARVVDAIAFAAHAHRAQRRKDLDATPYINHPVALVRILAVEAGIDDADVLCAAALHDYLEDCCGGDDGQASADEGREVLRRRFGDAVLRLVDAVTDDKALPRAERKRLQVAHAAQVPHGARLIMLADKIANLRDLVEFPPADWPVYRRREYFDWAASVVDRLRGTHGGLEALFEAAHALGPAPPAHAIARSGIAAIEGAGLHAAQ